MSARASAVAGILDDLDGDDEPVVEPVVEPVPAPVVEVVEPKPQPEPEPVKKLARKKAAPKVTAPEPPSEEASEVPSYLHTLVHFDSLVGELRAQASLPPKRRGPRKAQMNSQITTTVIDDFTDLCDDLGFPRQVVLEHLMRAAIAVRPERLKEQK